MKQDIDIETKIEILKLFFECKMTDEEWLVYLNDTREELIKEENIEDS